MSCKRNFFKDFEDIVDFSLFSYYPNTYTDYEWMNDEKTHMIIKAPGLKQEDLDVSINGDNTLVFKYTTKYHKDGKFTVKRFLLPQAVKEVKVSVDNGMINVVFINKTSDVSIIME